MPLVSRRSDFRAPFGFVPLLRSRAPALVAQGGRRAHVNGAFPRRFCVLRAMLLVEHREGPPTVSTFDGKTQPILAVPCFQGFLLPGNTGKALEKQPINYKIMFFQNLLSHHFPFPPVPLILLLHDSAVPAVTSNCFVRSRRSLFCLIRRRFHNRTICSNVLSLSQTPSRSLWWSQYLLVRYCGSNLVVGALESSCPPHTIVTDA